MVPVSKWYYKAKFLLKLSLVADYFVFFFIKIIVQKILYLVNSTVIIITNIIAMILFNLVVSYVDKSIQYFQKQFLHSKAFGNPKF